MMNNTTETLSLMVIKVDMLALISRSNDEH